MYHSSVKNKSVVHFQGHVVRVLPVSFNQRCSHFPSLSLIYIYLYLIYVYHIAPLYMSLQIEKRQKVIVRDR
jgi:hypothetical protein